jgi:spore germination cell wall hydrolase CwlJ-like protein
MSFFQRVATVATITLGLLASAGASTPGFAKELDRVANVATVTPVPSVVETAPLPAPVATPAVAQTVTGDGDANEDYVSLQQAIAAHQDRTEQSDELTCLAGAIYFEAKSEPLSGQLAVGEVILNRTKSGRFPRSVCAVVKQPGQFAFVRGGQVPAIAPNSQYRTALAVARVALADAWDGPAPDALYFHARRVSPKWGRTTVAAIGNHIFYR